jgi:acyl transferase domain-containing protein
VEPDLVLGHSVGEIAALCVAGGVSLRDAARLVAARGRLMQALPPGGQMTSVMAPEARVLEALRGVEDAVTIAAVNAPEQVVISGDGGAVAEVESRLTAAGIRLKPLTVSHAFHSPLMRPMLDDFAAVVRAVAFTPPATPVVSCVEGTLATEALTRPEYWRRQVLEPVRFMEGISALATQGVQTFLEIGPQPVLLGLGRQCLAGRGASQAWLPSLRRGVDPWQTLLDSLAALHAAGTPVDWAGFDAPYPRRRQSLPAYPFARTQHWIPAAATEPSAAAVRSATPLPTPPAPTATRAAGVYELTWQPAARAETGVPAAALGHWLLFVPRHGGGAALVEHLTGRGARVTTVRPGRGLTQVAPGEFELSAATIDQDLPALWTAAVRDDEPLTVV